MQPETVIRSTRMSCSDENRPAVANVLIGKGDELKEKKAKVLIESSRPETANGVPKPVAATAGEKFISFGIYGNWKKRERVTVRETERERGGGERKRERELEEEQLS